MVSDDSEPAGVVEGGDFWSPRVFSFFFRYKQDALCKEGERDHLAG